MVGPTAREASEASDLSADAATAALGGGQYDLDFAAYSRRRAAMYARAAGPDVRRPDPAEADLLVVGNVGLSTIAGRLLGSVPANVARRSKSDVLIVHTTP